MRIELTPQQHALRRELGGYFERLLTPQRREALTFVDGQFRDGQAYLDVIRQLGTDGWLDKWAGRKAMGGTGPLDGGSVAVQRRRRRRRRADPVSDHQHHRADHHAPRHRSAAAVLPAEDRRGLALHFSVGYSEVEVLAPIWRR